MGSLMPNGGNKFLWNCGGDFSNQGLRKADQFIQDAEYKHNICLDEVAPNLPLSRNDIRYEAVTPPQPISEFPLVQVLR